MNISNTTATASQPTPRLIVAYDEYEKAYSVFDTTRSKNNFLQVTELCELLNAPTTRPPRIGEVWKAQGGIYAGLSRGEDGEPDAHLVLLPDVVDKDMPWADAVKWAEDIGNGARLPTRFESALLYANVRDQLDTDHWYWTGTPYSEAYAWLQYFYVGYQGLNRKSYEGRARAVRRLTA